MPNRLQGVLEPDTVSRRLGAAIARRGSASHPSLLGVLLSEDREIKLSLIRGAC